MEVPFSPETERQLNDLAALTGRAPGDLVQDVMAGYVEELAQARAMLDTRYDDLLHVRVSTVSAEDAVAHFQRKSQARSAATRPRVAIGFTRKHSSTLTKSGSTLPRTTWMPPIV